jgi:transcriptional regulator with XRE-family HTH domain
MSQREETYDRLVFQRAALKSLRQRQRLTLRALAQRLGVTFQAVHSWEKDVTDPSADLLPIIAQELGCEIGDLYLRTAPPPRAMIDTPAVDQGFLQELLTALLLEGVPRRSDCAEINRRKINILGVNMVGVRGFEPPTPSSRTMCATRLRYTPTSRR